LCRPRAKYFNTRAAALPLPPVVLVARKTPANRRCPNQQVAVQVAPQVAPQVGLQLPAQLFMHVRFVAAVVSWVVWTMIVGMPPTGRIPGSSTVSRSMTSFAFFMGVVLS